MRACNWRALTSFHPKKKQSLSSVKVKGSVSSGCGCRCPSNEISSVVRGSADENKTCFGLIEFPFCRAAQALPGSWEEGGGVRGGEWDPFYFYLICNAIACEIFLSLWPASTQPPAWSDALLSVTGSPPTSNGRWTMYETPHCNGRYTNLRNTFMNVRSSTHQTSTISTEGPHYGIHVLKRHTNLLHPCAEQYFSASYPTCLTVRVLYWLCYRSDHLL